MSYDSQERSSQGSLPVELYEISVGDEVYRYSSSETVVVLGGNSYDRRAIGRDRIELGPGGPEPIAVTLPADDDFVVRHGSTIPSRVPRCRILRHQIGTGESITIYNGSVASVELVEDARVAKVAVQSDLFSGNSSMPRYSHQTSCNHQLYGPGCRAAPISFAGTVSAIDGIFVTVPGASTFAVPGLSLRARPFVNGFVRPLGIDDVRSVYGQEGDVLELLYPFRDLSVGAEVTVTLGCDHLQLGDCLKVFKNTDRFAGFLYTPSRNPFQGSIA